MPGKTSRIKIHGSFLKNVLVWRNKAQLLREQGLYSSRSILSVDHQAGQDDRPPQMHRNGNAATTLLRSVHYTRMPLVLQSLRDCFRISSNITYPATRNKLASLASPFPLVFFPASDIRIPRHQHHIILLEYSLSPVLFVT